MKTQLLKDIINLGLFKVASSPDESQWIPLKNGSRTPIFLDTSKFISYPELLTRVNRFALKLIKDQKITFDRIISAPYGGLPFSYGLASILKFPSLAIRKEGPKNYSTAGELLGVYRKGDKVLIIEDATVTADTVLDFAKKLRAKGLKVTDIITVLDIEKSAKDNLKKSGIELHSLFTWRELYDQYKKDKHRNISEKMSLYLDRFVGSNK